MSGRKHLGPGLSAESLLGVLSAESLLGAESLLCNDKAKKFARPFGWRFLSLFWLRKGLAAA